MKSFRASEKQNSDLVFLINTQNPEEFYVYEGERRPFKHDQIYTENQLLFDGRYVHPSSKQKKRTMLLDDGYTILTAQPFNYKKCIILSYTRKGWKRYNDDVYVNMEAARSHITFLCARRPRHIEETDY
jgi:hypothetical protein